MQNRPALFRGWHFEDVIIILCVQWYLRYSLSYRDLKEIMAERGLSVDHVTIWRWIQRYAPVLNQRIRRELRHPNQSWRVDETCVRVAGNWALCVATTSFDLDERRATPHSSCARCAVHVACQLTAPPQIVKEQ
jgi:transposase-like protein